MPTPKPPAQPMSDGLHATMSKVLFRVEAHSKNLGVAKRGLSKNRVFKKLERGVCLCFWCKAGETSQMKDL